MMWLLTVWTSLKNNFTSKCLDMWTWCGVLNQYSLYLMDWLTFKEKGCCHCKISGHLRDTRNTAVENTMCCIYPNFLHSIKIRHFIYFTCIEIWGYYFRYKCGVWLKVLVQIYTACARVYTLDLSSSYQQWGPHFPFVWQVGRAQLMN